MGPAHWHYALPEDAHGVATDPITFAGQRSDSWPLAAYG
jgi:hypothetical protein